MEKQEFYKFTKTFRKNTETSIIMNQILKKPESFKQFVKNEFDINSKNSEGFALIHVAVVLENEEFVKLLIECGADVENICSNGFRPLHLAVLVNSVRMINVLLEFAEVDINSRTGFGFNDSIIFNHSIESYLQEVD